MHNISDLLPRTLLSKRKNNLVIDISMIEFHISAPLIRPQQWTCLNPTPFPLYFSFQYLIDIIINISRTSAVQLLKCLPPWAVLLLLRRCEIDSISKYGNSLTEFITKYFTVQILLWKLVLPIYMPRWIGLKIRSIYYIFVSKHFHIRWKTLTYKYITEHLSRLLSSCIDIIGTALSTI